MCCQPWTFCSLLRSPWPNVEFVRYECLISRGGTGAADWLRQIADRWQLPVAESSGQKWPEVTSRWVQLLLFQHYPYPT
jgi:hypothetical protein